MSSTQQLVPVTGNFVLSLSLPMSTRDPTRSLRVAQPEHIEALRGHWIVWCLPECPASPDLRLQFRVPAQPWQQDAELQPTSIGARTDSAPDGAKRFIAYVAHSVMGLAVEGPLETLNRFASMTLSVGNTPPETASNEWRRIALLDKLGFVGAVGLAPLDDVAGFICEGGTAAWFATLPRVGRWQLHARLRVQPRPNSPVAVTVDAVRSDGTVRRLGASTNGMEVTLTLGVEPEDLMLRLVLPDAAAGSQLWVEDLCWQPATTLPAVSDSMRARWRRLRRSARLHFSERDVVRSPLPRAFAAPAILRFALEPGWYFLRLEAQRHEAPGYIHLLGLDGSAEIACTPDRPRRLPLRPGRWAKRLLRVTRAALLALGPPTGSRMPDLRTLSLTRVPATFVRTRVERKLLAAHPGFARQSVATLRKLPLDDLWPAYEAVFDQDSQALVGYQDWIELAELAPAATVSPPSRRWGIALLDRGEGLSGAVGASIESVFDQTITNWVLELLTPAPIDSADLRVSWRPVHEAAALGSALSAAAVRTDVDTWLLLRAGDRLAPDALAELGGSLGPSTASRAAYADDDCLLHGGGRADPDFKPDASPDLLLGRDYVSVCMALDAALLREALRIGPLEQAAEAYDLALRASELDSSMAHVRRVLCHRTDRDADHRQDEAAVRAVTAALRRRDPNAEASRVQTIAPGLRRLYWPRPTPAPLVSLIVPTRDRLEVLRVCVDSILARTDYAPFELIVVDNQSVEPATLTYLCELKRDSRARVLRYDQPFNYSAINNEAAVQARGSVIGLINNDIEVIGPNWLDEMVSLAVRPEIGCVGAKLLYPDDRLQHAGVFVGLSGLADHAGRGLPRSDPGPQRRHWVVQEVSAVTAAAMVVRRDVFEAVGGLDAEALPVAFNDVDLCLKVQRAGWRNLWTPHAELYHHESYSRGADVSEAQRARFRGECAVMRLRWADVIARDPYYPLAYARVGHGYGLSMGSGEQGRRA